MIKTASFRNFKCLRDVHVDLERFTVLVGPNASGKSSILQGLELVCRAFDSENADPKQDLIPHRTQGSRDLVELTSRVGDCLYRYSETEKGDSAERVPKRPGIGRTESLDNEPDSERPWKFESDKPRVLPTSGLLRLETSNLLDPRPPNDPTRITFEGKGMHSALANMALNDPDSWQLLQKNLRGIIPTIRRLRHTSTGKNHSPSLLFDTRGADSLTARQVSEGTLIVLGILTALHGPERPSLVLLDDLDRGLHPRAQRDLIKLLRGLLDTNPELQLVATTHSPYLLDCMQPTEVRMTLLDERGATVCAALTSHPEFPRWKEEMAPGELWSHFGEKWLVEESSP